MKNQGHLDTSATYYRHELFNDLDILPINIDRAVERGELVGIPDATTPGGFVFSGEAVAAWLKAAYWDSSRPNHFEKSLAEKLGA